MKHLYPVILLLLLSCQGTETNKLDGQNAVSVNSRKELLNPTTQSEERAALFNKDTEFEIIKSNTSASHPSSASDTSMCKGWTLRRTEIRNALKGFEPIDVHVWHHSYDVLPCIVDGLLMQNGKEYEFSINAGSYLTITNKDTTLFFGDEEKEFEKLFLSSPWTEEDDNK